MKKLKIENILTVQGSQEDFEKAFNNDSQFKQAILDFLEGQEKGENYGLAFYACGYNGQKQSEFISDMQKLYNLEVF